MGFIQSLEELDRIKKDCHLTRRKSTNRLPVDLDSTLLWVFGLLDYAIRFWTYQASTIT